MPEELCKKEEPEDKEAKGGEPEDKQESNIAVAYPESGDTAGFPFRIEGIARVFENNLNFEIKDKNGNLLLEGFMTANSPDIGQFGPFETEVKYLLRKPETEDIIIEVFWHSPKDGSRLDVKSIPVKFSVGDTDAVKVFFNNSKMDPEYSCNKVFPVSRIIPRSEEPSADALNVLLEGVVSASERKKGFSTSINTGVKVNRYWIEKEIAKADFDETLELNVGGSCRVSAIRAQITQTVMQFPGIKGAVISVNGRTEDILQP